MRKNLISFAAVSSLSEFFIRYAAITLALVVITLSWFAYETYSYHIDQKRSTIELTITKTEINLTGVFDYAESITNYINNFIFTIYKYNIEFIGFENLNNGNYYYCNAGKQL